MEAIWRHWTQGGTGITNFDAKNYHLYQRAISAHPELELWVEKRRINGTICEDSFSLHDNSFHDLSAFWRTFEAFRKEGQPLTEGGENATAI